MLQAQYKPRSSRSLRLLWTTATLLLVSSTSAFSLTPTRKHHDTARNSSFRLNSSIAGIGVNATPQIGESSSMSDDDSFSSIPASSTTTSSPWRITLDIGREPLATGMPFDWARSGCRLPLTIPCDFASSAHVTPRTETIFFTGPDGAVVRPIEGGSWEWKTDENGSNKDNFRFTLTFPEEMSRRDVSIDAGTTIECSGTMYSQDDVDRLNKDFYEAREATWQVGGELNQMTQRQGAAKKWNEESNQWEERYAKENPFSQASKQFQYWMAKQNQNRKHQQRPDPQDLSEVGTFPTFSEGVYMLNGGIVRRGKNGPVMGKWYAQPVTNQPVSYRS